jgi:hypothetical protein
VGHINSIDFQRRRVDGGSLPTQFGGLELGLSLCQRVGEISEPCGLGLVINRELRCVLTAVQRVEVDMACEWASQSHQI